MTVATLGQHPRFWEIICFASYASFFAGFVNGIFLITFATFVSSVNGVLSLVALQYLSVGSAIKGSILLAQIVTFFFGGICAGFFFDEQLVVSPQLALGGLGVCLGVFVTVAVFSVGTEAAKQASVFVAAFSMGLQNAMGSFFSKGVLRTTHQSGAVTDLGIFVGQWLQLRCCARSKLKPPEYWRVRAQLPVLLGEKSQTNKKKTETFDFFF
jgi:hypothetical protein